jgi:GNAT superfamily N-acetyltransferase
MRVEPAQKIDAEALAGISKDAFYTDNKLDSFLEVFGPQSPGGPPGYDSPDFQKFIMKIMNYYKILVDDKIVGGLFFSSANRDHYVLERIFVSPSYHRKGIARRAMELILDKHLDAKFWTLGTPNWNRRTQKFYEKLGFKQIGWEEAENPDWRGVWYQKTVNAYSLPQIKELKVSKGPITIEGTIAHVGSPKKIIQSNEKGMETVVEAVIEDGTGKINFMIKEFQLPYISSGTKVRVEYALVESRSGNLMLDWKYGRIINLI